MANMKKLMHFGRSYFGEYAGYAQEYLFHYERTQTLDNGDNLVIGYWCNHYDLTAYSKELISAMSKEFSLSLTLWIDLLGGNFIHAMIYA